ncbi:hypothetical protein D0Z07_0718 [Hyphodiscus hymeniophilus]|uniref:Uncharacterized protein n=1 Tax=Hyphodiscus hymeniophilus TaxID=353542 RepID=A0A9P7B0D9_9HELO|nr:hypothetical protein D0Z07_0718 [Hyphodiscus hymeniophilus]
MTALLIRAVDFTGSVFIDVQATAKEANLGLGLEQSDCYAHFTEKIDIRSQPLQIRYDSLSYPSQRSPRDSICELSPSLLPFVYLATQFQQFKFTTTKPHPKTRNSPILHPKSALMSGNDEKTAAATTANALTISRPSNARQNSHQSIEILSTIEDVDSTHSMSPTVVAHSEKSLEREASPFSPFYNPAPTRYSLEAQKSESRQNINVINSAYDTDVEALTPQSTKNVGLLKSKSGNPECAVWPGQNAMKMKKKAMRRERNKHNVCGCMAGLDKRTKIWIKVVIAVVVIGTAIGVGVGVSKAVGGGIWKSSDNSNAPIAST